MAERKKRVTNIAETEILTSDLAAIVGKSSRRIRQLTAEGTLKQSNRGKFILGDAVQQFIEHVEGGRKEDDKPRLIDEKTEHERIKKEKAALELAELQGKLHKSEDVEAVMNDMLGAFRQRIRAIPMRLAPELVAEGDLNVIKGKIAAALDEALAELADYDPELFREVQTGADADGESS